MNNNKYINAIRFLGVDMINKANSGHPGIVLGASPIIYTLFTKHLNINPKNPFWFNRDRFILSAGHGSAMLYAMNHLYGYDLSLEDLKKFRQLNSKTPGHPELDVEHGIETTTGPLGQGVAMSVGFAIAEEMLRARFNKDKFKIVDHYTYVLCGDGDLQEGVAQEAMSLAGRLKLNKLIVLFDSNDVQLDGPTNLAVNEDFKKKTSSIGWDYILVKDGTSVSEIDKAIKKAKQNKKPTFIEIKTIIGYGLPLQGTSKTHGSAPSDKEREYLANKLNWNYEPFFIPQEIYEHFNENVYKRVNKLTDKYNKDLAEYSKKYKELYQEFELFCKNNLTLDFDKYKKLFNENDEIATRNISGKIINELSKEYKNIVGGSADLSSSTKAKGADGNFDINNRLARNINYGVREFAMAAINNGILLHGGLRPFASGFFAFSDYMKPALRLAALMKIPNIFVFTHDSVAVGEDGPTHEPIEHLAMLRSIPNFNVIRPCDATETICAYKYAIESKTVPVAIILTRQSVKSIKNSSKEGFYKGAYIVSKENKKLDGILLATGSEVELALEVKELLKEHNKDIRVVSMPSPYLFDKQDDEYKQKTLPKNNVPIMSIELGTTFGWHKYATHCYGVDRFGLSAPFKDILKELNFTAKNIKDTFLKLF